MVPLLRGGGVFQVPHVDAVDVEGGQPVLNIPEALFKNSRGGVDAHAVGLFRLFKDAADGMVAENNEHQVHRDNGDQQAEDDGGTDGKGSFFHVRASFQDVIYRREGQAFRTPVPHP